MRNYPAFLQNTVESLPDKFGVYFFRDAAKKALYIGKARSIRKRVLSHLAHWGEPFSKEGKMLSEMRHIDWVQTPSEAEALLLEAALVKEQNPKFNQELKDDKSYPYLKITDEEYPRLLLVRGRRGNGKYFGPYTSVRLLRQALAFLRRFFPMRTCQPMPDKLCLMYHIGQCKGPCAGEIPKEGYLRIVKDLEFFLEGRRELLIKSLTARMQMHSRKKEYEKAKALYEEIKALSSMPKESSRPRQSASALKQLEEALGLPRFPVRIECFDISNIAGREAVGSLVVFVDGRPSKRDYRHFRIRGVRGIDDYQMMREVVRRRYTRLLEEEKALPDLVIIDGGKAHLSEVCRELRLLKLPDLPVISIAKQHEHVFTTAKDSPTVFPQSAPVLHLVQNLRDEAHRFAIGFHRRLHRKEALLSELDAVPGVGPKTIQKLLLCFGSVSRMKKMSPTEMTMERGISPRLAQLLANHFISKYFKH